MVVHELWRDTKRPDVWAVEMRDGQVVGCCGPLTLGEAELGEEILDTLEYSPAKAAWMRRHRDRFHAWEPLHEEIWPT